MRPSDCFTYGYQEAQCTAATVRVGTVEIVTEVMRTFQGYDCCRCPYHGLTVLGLRERKNDDEEKVHDSMGDCLAGR